VNLNGENYPRLVFYPDDSTTAINFQPIFVDAMTNEAFNNGGGMHGFNSATEGWTLTNSTQNGVSLNNGNPLLPAVLNLTSIFPANGPLINPSTSPVSGCIGQTITINGNYFSQRYDSVYIAGQPCNITVLNPNSCQVIIPSVITGPTTLTMTDGVHPPSTIPFTVNGQPSITGISPTQGASGTNIILTGVNFGNPDSNSQVLFGTAPGTVVNWTNTQITATVPNNLPFTPLQVAVNTDCGESSSIQFIVINPDSLVLSPHVQTVSETNTFQFDAKFYAGSNPAVDVSTNPGTTWSVNGANGGEAVHGTITSSGLYTAPATPPPTNIVVTVQYYDPNNGLFLQDNAMVNLVESPTIVITPSNSSIPTGSNQQFTVSLFVNGVATDVTNSSTLSVNGTVGGTIVDGTITNTGLYIAPNNLTQPTNETIQATYLYQSTNTELVATTLVTVGQANSDHASITVLSQINIFLGDGRFAYVPTGTTFIAYPAQYVYVQINELLDNTYHLPVSTYIPIQQVAIQTKNALDSDIANVMYNLGNMTLNPDGTINTQRTVVLGIIDPSDGRFHSLWDIANPIPPPA